MDRRPHDGAVGPHVAPLVGVGVVTGGHPARHRLPERQLVGMGVLRPPPPDQQIRRSPEEVAHRRVHAARNAVEVDDGGADAGLLEADLEARLGRPPHPVGLDALGVVHQRADQLDDGAVVGQLRHGTGVDPALLRIGADDAVDEVEGDAPLGGVSPRLGPAQTRSSGWTIETNRSPLGSSAGSSPRIR